MAMIFDESTHTYTLNGSRVPSVTQVIHSVLPGWQADDWYLQRGRAVHHGCALLDQGRLDWLTVSPEIESRIRAWEAFMSDFKVPREGDVIEGALGSERYRFAGTVDRVFGGVEDIIVDLKNTIEPQVQIQLGGYSLLWKESTGRKVAKAAAVELRTDGKYSAQWMDRFAINRAEQTFLACLTVFNFKTTHKIGDKHGR